MKLFQIVFVIVSVNNIFSAEKTCVVKFYKLADAVNNVFDCDSGKQVSDLSFNIKYKDLLDNKNRIIEFLKNKISGKFTNAEIKIYLFIGFDENLRRFRELPTFLPPKTSNTLDKEIDATQENAVHTLINDAIQKDGALNVYFYPHAKQQTPTGSKKKTSGENDGSKKCCC